MGTLDFIGVHRLTMRSAVSGAADLMSSKLKRRHYRGEQQRTPVRCKRFDAILKENNIGPIDFLSLDVEDAEMTVLNTMDWLANPVHIMVIERGRTDRERKERRSALQAACMQLHHRDQENDWWINKKFPAAACS